LIFQLFVGFTPILRAARMAMLDDLMGYMKTFEGVWFSTLEEVAHWHMTQRQPEGR
jgi:hypothetical protein